MVLVGFKPDLWRPTDFLQCFDIVGLVIWPVKIVSEMTYYVSSGTLSPTHSLTPLCDSVKTTAKCVFTHFSSRCAEKRLKCDACTLSCARQMESYTGSHRCNVTADDADDGRSPRLRYCLACCQHDDCSRVCQVYASRECRRVRYVFAASLSINPVCRHSTF